MKYIQTRPQKLYAIEVKRSRISMGYTRLTVRSKHPQFISDTEKYLKVKSFDNLT